MVIKVTKKESVDKIKELFHEITYINDEIYNETIKVKLYDNSVSFINNDDIVLETVYFDAMISTIESTDNGITIYVRFYGNDFTNMFGIESEFYI